MTKEIYLFMAVWYLLGLVGTIGITYESGELTLVDLVIIPIASISGLVALLIWASVLIDPPKVVIWKRK